MSGPVGITAPNDLAGVLIKRRHPAAHAHLAAAVADEDFPFGRERRHGHGLAGVDVAEPGVPKLLSGLRVERDGVIVERGDEDLAVIVGKPATHDIAQATPCADGFGFGL